MRMLMDSLVLATSPASSNDATRNHGKGAMIVSQKCIRIQGCSFITSCSLAIRDHGCTTKPVYAALRREFVARQRSFGLQHTSPAFPLTHPPMMNKILLVYLCLLVHTECNPLTNKEPAVT